MNNDTPILCIPILSKTLNKQLLRIFYTLAIIVTGIIVWHRVEAQETIPTVDEINQDIQQFQGFFSARFPDLTIENYQNGVRALPQYANQRLNDELLLELPPYTSELEKGAFEWQQNRNNKGSLADCFAGKPPPTAYPYFFNGEVHTIVGDINQCFMFLEGYELDPLGPDIARLEAYFKAPWAGEKIDIDFRNPEIRELYQQGRQYFWAKRGQMNLSCANCHVHNAGNQLRGDVLSAALGHGSGYPAYSVTWSKETKQFGTLHRRYAACNAMVGANPMPGQNNDYISLEIYQAIMNTGVPINAPGLRQ